MLPYGARVISVATTTPGIDLGQIAEGALSQLGPVAPWLAIAAIVVTFLRFPMPGRGAGLFASRDPWRLFKYDARRLVMDRAGGRCEESLVLLWGRCRRAAEQADHIYPWSRGGATVPSNGQALCARCNRSKSNTRPAWWYILGLERRRQGYFPPGEAVRVSASMTAADRALRASPQATSQRQLPRHGPTSRAPSRRGRR